LRTGECAECFREYPGPHPSSMPVIMPVTIILHGVQMAKHKRKVMDSVVNDLTLLFQLGYSISEYKVI